jgi:hypothetical protein
MSLNSGNDSIIGQSISTAVTNQLAVRKKILSSPKYQSDPSKNTNEYLNYTNGNTGWVRISSSVDTLSVDSNFSSGTARQNVLLGGTISYEQKRAGIFAANSSYDSTPFGVRPMAGITSMTVENRSYGGALRMGSFEIKINSLEQLSTLEQLYMRPGFTVFIEYGHSTYINSSGEVKSDIKYLQDYFDYTDKEAVTKAALELRNNESEYNYDFMFGYITNFTWQTTEVGEYLANVTFTTSGDLIDSIKASIPGGGKIDSESDASISLKDKTTALHNILWVINNTDTEKYYDKETLQTDPNKNIKTQKKVEDALTKYCNPAWDTIKTALNSPLTIIQTQIGETPSSGSWYKYVSLRFLLECINHLFVPVSNLDQKLFKFDSTKYTPFTTFKQHICIDPSVAVLPKKRFTTQDTNFKYLFAEQEEIQGEETDILNIHINIKFITDLLQSLVESSEMSDKSIYVFIEEILKRLTVDLGNINDFDLHLDDDTDTFYIVDRTVLPDPKKFNDTRTKLDIFGIGTTVEKFTMGSSVPSSMTAMIAVSAGAHSSDMREGSHSLFRWNDGLRDRVIGGIVNTGTIEDQLDTIRKEMIGFVRYLKNCNASAWYLNYNREEMAAARPLHGKIMSIMVEYYSNSPEKPEDRVNSAGLIPISLKLTLKGISGLKIGEAFTVPDQILPDRYKEKVAFQITRLKNTVSDNKWLTDIDAIMFPLNVPQDISREVNKLPQITVEDLEKEFNNVPEIAPPPPPDLVFAKPLVTLSTRSDGQGDGNWLASRRNSDGSKRFHTGWDVLASPGQIVTAPIDGQVFKNLNFGAHGHPVIGILGTGDYNGYIVLLGYCDWPGKVVPTAKKGDIIGKVVDLSKPYGSKPSAYPKDMNNHVHIKITYNGEVLDPSTLNYV